MSYETEIREERFDYDEQFECLPETNITPMLNDSQLIQLHQRLNYLLERKVKSKLLIAEVRISIADYKSLTAIEKYHIIYNESDFKAELRKYERYYQILNSAYNRCLSKIVNNPTVIIATGEMVNNSKVVIVESVN